MLSCRSLSYFFALSALGACSNQPTTAEQQAQPDNVSVQSPAPNQHDARSSSIPAPPAVPDPRYAKRFSDELELQCALDTLSTKASYLHGTISEADLDAARDYYKTRVSSGDLGVAFNSYKSEVASKFIPECASLGITSAEQCFGDYYPIQRASQTLSCVQLYTSEFGHK